MIREADPTPDMNVKTRRPAPVPHGRLSNWTLAVAVVAVALAALALRGF
jgi:hypothetical protein